MEKYVVTYRTANAGRYDEPIRSVIHSYPNALAFAIARVVREKHPATIYGPVADGRDGGWRATVSLTLDSQVLVSQPPIVRLSHPFLAPKPEPKPATITEILAIAYLDKRIEKLEKLSHAHRKCPVCLSPDCVLHHDGAAQNRGR